MGVDLFYSGCWPSFLGIDLIIQGIDLVFQGVDLAFLGVDLIFLDADLIVACIGIPFVDAHFA